MKYMVWFLCTALAVILTVPLYYEVLVPYVNGMLYFSFVLIGIFIHTYGSMKRINLRQSKS